jgi:hypothetical protein
MTHQRKRRGQVNHRVVLLTLVFFQTGCSGNGRAGDHQQAQDSGPADLRIVEVVAPLTISYGPFLYSIHGIDSGTATQAQSIAVRMKVRNTGNSEARLAMAACSLDLLLYRRGEAAVAVYSRNRNQLCADTDAEVIMAPGDTLAFRPELSAETVERVLPAGLYELRVTLPGTSPLLEATVGTMRLETDDDTAQGAI